MNNKKYEELAKEIAPKKKVGKNITWAFLGGGILALVMQGVFDLLTKVCGVGSEDALMYNSIIVIILTMILTMIGSYKKMAQVLGAGMFIPITGFANSVISETIEYRSEGPIYGIGSRMFALAGSVITYGICGSVLYGIVIFVLKACGVNL